MAKQEQVNPIARTSAGLREAIFEEIDNVRRGVSNPTRANAISKLVMSMVETVRMELEVQRFVNQGINPAANAVESVEGNGDVKPTLLGGPLKLGA